ncbi:MAG TPA: hypothetical protein VLT58_00390 [Polyangia bacterium]|nr:hypothetical protein [Polyangia bacterium]
MRAIPSLPMSATRLPSALIARDVARASAKLAHRAYAPGVSGPGGAKMKVFGSGSHENGT